MIPLLLIGDENAQEEYSSRYIAENKIPSYALHTIEKDKAHISIAEIRSIAQLLIQYRGIVTCIKVLDFDTATIEAQNAFLKTLEEIDVSHHVLLCCTNADDILPTILSRCKKVFLDVATKPNTEIVIGDSWLTETSSNHKKGIPLAERVIYTTAAQLRKNPAVKVVKTIHSLLEVYAVMKKNNVNAELSLDEMYFLLEEA
jgi:DNA polymerase III, delta subunit